MESKTNRKDAIREYKEQKPARGIYAAKRRDTGESWVDAHPNLGAAKNAFWHLLRNDQHTNKELQALYNAHGEAVVEFEIVEEIDGDTPALLLRDMLKQRKKHWIEQLGARSL